MWELIVCVTVAWSSSCQPERIGIYPSAYFCDRAAAQVMIWRKDVRQIYCLEKTR